MTIPAGNEAAKEPQPAKCEHGKTGYHMIDPTMAEIFWHERRYCPGGGTPNIRPRQDQADA